MTVYAGNKLISKINVGAQLKYFKNVYEEFTLPQMTSQTTPFGSVSTNMSVVIHMSDLYHLFWNNSTVWICNSYNLAGARYIQYNFAHYLEANVEYTFSVNISRQQNVTNAFNWYYRTDDGDFLIISPTNVPIDNNMTGAGTTYTATFNPAKPVKCIFFANNLSTSSSSHINFYMRNVNLTRTDGNPLRYIVGSVESNSSDYDYTEFVKTNISEVYHGNTLVYQWEENWEMPQMTSNNSNGIVLTNSNMGNPYLCFDKNTGTTNNTNESWGGWINIALPYRVYLTGARIYTREGDKHGAGIIYGWEIRTAQSDGQIILPYTSLGANVDRSFTITDKIVTNNIFLYINGWWQCAREIWLYGKKIM